GHWRRRDRGRSYRHQYCRGQAGALCGERHHHHPGGGHPGAALDLCGTLHRLQSDHFLPDADHGAAGRSQPALGSGAGSDPAIPAVRMAECQFPQPLFHHPGPFVHRHRLRRAAWRTGRGRGPVEAPAPQWGGRMMTTLVEITGLKKQFGGLTAVNEVSFAVTEGETVALLGPNGSGKTTVLNMISGAFPPTAGTIAL